MAEEEQFSLCWNNYNSNLSTGFHESLCRGDLVDVTLAAEGHLVKAHRLVLSVCSPYFRKMFTQMPANQHAFVFLKDVSHSALKDLIQFMYCGEVNVKQDALPSFISTAEALQIKGLTETGDTAPSQSPIKAPSPPPQIPTPSHQSPPRRNQRATHKATVFKHQQQQQQQQQHLDSDESCDEKVIQVQVPQKRQQRNSSPIKTVTKRMRVDPLDHSVSETATTTNAQLISTLSGTPEKLIDEPEFIELPIDTIPTKSEPEYVDEHEQHDPDQDVDASEQEGNYVEDDSYGDMKYDESYFTENEESKAGISGFTESFNEGEQSSGEAQGQVKYIRSQKKNAQLVHEGCVFNKKQTQGNGHTTWRCVDVVKSKCRAVCITKESQLVSSRRSHNHSPHWSRISNRAIYDMEDALEIYENDNANHKYVESLETIHTHGQHSQATNSKLQNSFQVLVPNEEDY